MRKIGFALACVAGLAAASQATAQTYVGSWTVDQGPTWTTVPVAYTGQEAAALLFGGTAADYLISTVDDQAANIDSLSWVSTWGGACGSTYPCGTQVAHNFEISTAGLYQNVGDTSAYVNDWAIGSQYRNFAFQITGVPEPSTWAMMLFGFGAVGYSIRRAKRVKASFAAA